MAYLQPLLHQIWQELQNITPYNSLILSIALIATIFFLKTLATRSSSKFKYPPSPPKLPLIGNIHQLGSLPHRSLLDLSKKHGPIMLLELGSKKALVISSVEILRELVKNHDIEFSNRPNTKGVKILFYEAEDLVFAPYDEYWRQTRKVCVHQLLSSKRVQSFQSIREEEVATLVERIRTSCGKINGVNKPVNLTEMLTDVSNNIISRCVYGKKSDDNENGKNKIGEIIRDVAVLLGSVCFEDFFPLMGWIDVLTGLVLRMKRTFLKLDSFLEQVITEHKSGLKKSSRNEDFVDILLRLQSSGTLEFVLTQKRLKAIILDMIAGGTETSTTTMEWIMTELIKNPKVLKKAQQEIRKIVGEKQKIEGTDMSQMSYLRCVIKEGLRLHCPLPLLVPRETTKLIKLAGYDIPAQTRVLVNAWAIQRDCSVWGENADKFIPERFEDNLVDYKGQDFEFLPFGVGRRGCVGVTFGYAVVEIVLANLLCWFDWDLPDGVTPENLDMGEVYGVTAFKKVNLQLVPTLP